MITTHILTRIVNASLKNICALLVASLCSSLALQAMAQTAGAVWPNKTLRMIAPQAPGGAQERTIRGIAQGLSEKLGKQVIVEYKAGAAGNLGAAEVANSPADGYTWMLGPENMLTINPHLYKSLGYTRGDVVPVNLIASLNQTLACNPKLGINTFAEFVMLAKTKKLTYATPGAGSNGHLVMEALLEDLKIEMTHVPYRSLMQPIQDVVGGQVDCLLMVTSPIVEFVKSKRLIGLATTANTRLQSLPDLPTFKELGKATIDGNIWLAMFAHKNTPQPIVDRFNKALDEVMRSPEVSEIMTFNNTVIVTTDAATAQATFAKVSNQWSAVIKRVNISID